MGGTCSELCAMVGISGAVLSSSATTATLEEIDQIEYGLRVN